MKAFRGDLHAIVRLLSVALLLAALSWGTSALPFAEALQEVHRRLDAQPLLFGALFVLAYVVSALLMTPGAILTIAGGALFGIVRGTLLVSLASTLAAALAFLVARGFGRPWVERLARRHSFWWLVDRSVAEHPWRNVLLLRLSPLLPYSASNYLLGLCALRFRDAISASFVGMLPGTLMFVVMGRLGSGVRDPSLSSDWGWALAAVGVLATVALVVLLGRSALRSLRDGDRDSLPDVEELPMDSNPRRRRVTLLFAALALLATVAAAWVSEHPHELRSALGIGPPVVEPEEVYEERPDGPVVDHSLLDGLLRAHVEKGGYVDYDALKKKSATLDRYLRQLEGLKLEPLGRSERLALLINAYNAFTLRLILDHWPKIASIRDLPKSESWGKRRWKLGGRVLSLDQIEHQEIRPKFAENRVHWALVCAAVGCPPLRAEAYRGARLEAQLADQARIVHSSPRWFRFDAKANALELTKLYDWYGKDFLTKTIRTPIEAAARHHAGLRTHIEKKETPSLGWISYDWRLNSIRNRTK